MSLQNSYARSDGDAASRRLVFAGVALAVCLILAVRPVPSLDAENDTGRYLFDFYSYCADPLGNLLDTSASSVGGGLSWMGFHLLVLPLCATPADFVFLLVTAGLLPLGLILFTPWSRGSVGVAVALIVSVHGVTLMSDALRQGASLFFLLGALDARRPVVFRVVCATVAVAVHSSAATMLPVVLFSIGGALSLSRPAWAVLAGAIAAAVTALVAHLANGGFGDSLVDRAASLSAIYATDGNALFSVFMALPAMIVIGIRLVAARSETRIEEVVGGVGYLVAVGIAATLFPYIVYRIALTGTVVQVALLLNAGRRGSVSGSLVSLLLVGHMLVFTLMSDNVAVTLFGEP